MTPRLGAFQRSVIERLLQLDVRLNASQIAEVAKCSTRTVYYVKKQLKHPPPPPLPEDASSKPTVRKRRKRLMTADMVAALLVHLSSHPGMFEVEMADWILDEFDVKVSQQTISRTLKEAGYSQAGAQQRQMAE